MIVRLLALAATLSTGCSFFAVSTPSQRPVPPAPLDCKTDTSAPALDATFGGATLLLGGVIILQDQSHTGEDAGLVTALFGAPLVGFGALMAVSAIYGFTQTSRCRRFHDELGIPIVSEAEAAERRTRALSLTRAAAIAARSGQCATVVQISTTVMQLDPEVHATELARDRDIARCLAAPPAK